MRGSRSNQGNLIKITKNIGLQDNQVVRAAVEDRQGILKLVLNNREFDWSPAKDLKPVIFLISRLFLIGQKRFFNLLPAILLLH